MRVLDAPGLVDVEVGWPGSGRRMTARVTNLRAADWRRRSLEVRVGS